MAGEGNRIINLVKYAESLGIDINIGKNRAYGNKGLFKVNGSKYRIDISKTLTENEKLAVLIHEISHYIHYKYDKTLKNLDFIFKDFVGEYENELIELTVDSIPKDYAMIFFNEKQSLNNEIKKLTESIKLNYPEIELSDKNNPIEKEILKCEFKYLLNHDAVKVYSTFSNKLYSIKNIRTDFPNIKPIYVDYLNLNSAKRKLNRVNRKISRINKYYNSPSELLARSIEYYIMKPEIMCLKAPLVTHHYNKVVEANYIPELTQLVNNCNI